MTTQVSSGAEAVGSEDRTGAAGARESLWQRAKRGWPADSPLVQLPNAPLVVATTSLLVAAAVEGTAHDLAQATGLAALSAWAWLELTDGANLPRRSLGAGALVYVVVQVAEALGAR